MSRALRVVLWSFLLFGLAVGVPGGEAGAVPGRPAPRPQAQPQARPAVPVPGQLPPATIAVGGPTAAARSGRRGPALPEPLKPWVPWVLHGHESALCPQLLGRTVDADEKGEQDGAPCAWPGRLVLQLRDKNGTFAQSFQVYKRGLVTL